MKRILSIVAALALLLGLAAQAEAPDYPVVVFGSYEQNGDAEDGAEPLEWLVLEENDEACFLLCRYAIDNVPYQEASGETRWEDSDLRAWLNGEFLDLAFTEEERLQIQPVTLENFDNPDHGTDGGADTTDSVFLLDVQQVFRYFPTAEARMAYPTQAVKESGAITVHDNCLWRLRTPGKTSEHAVVVLTTGECDYCGLNVTYSLAGTRPALWIRK